MTFHFRSLALMCALLSLPLGACAEAEGEGEETAEDDIETAVVNVGYTYKLADGRLGVLTSVSGDNAVVSTYDKTNKRLTSVTVKKSTLTGFTAFSASAPNTSANASRRPSVASFFTNNTDYPLLNGQIGKLEVVWKNVDWMDYNCVANSVRKTTWDFPKSTMADQDAYYAKYGFAPVLAGKITVTHLRAQKGIEKVLIYALSSNPDHPRHAVVQDTDGLWNSKMGSGPHIRLVDAELLYGPDAGVPVRLYAKKR